MYWNPKTWSLSHTQTSAKDWRMPLPVGLLFMAVMGGLFVVFLPAVGFYLTGRVIISKGTRRCVRPGSS